MVKVMHTHESSQIPRQALEKMAVEFSKGLKAGLKRAEKTTTATTTDKKEEMNSGLDREIPAAIRKAFSNGLNRALASNDSRGCDCGCGGHGAEHDHDCSHRAHGSGHCGGCGHG